MQRPTSVLVFGILNLVFGLLGLCGTLAALAMMYGPLAEQMAQMGKDNVTVQLQADPTYHGFMLVMSVVGFPFTILLVAAGVGLLRMRPWGRTGSIVYGVYDIIATIAALVMNYVFILFPLMQRVDQLPEAERVGVMAGMMGGIAGGCISLIYPILLLVFMYRANVRAAFAAVAAAEMRTPPDSPFETGNPYQSR